MSTTAKTTRSRTRGVFTRDRGKLVVVSAATILCVYLSFRLAQPFIPALVWAITVAVITHSFVQWLGRWFKSRQWRAAVAVGTVAIALIAPATGLVYFGALQVASALQHWSPAEQFARLNTVLGEEGSLGQAWQRVSQNFDVAGTIAQIAEQVRQWTMAIVAGSVYFLVQLFIALFVLYFLYRDEGHALTSIRQLSPLSGKETDRLLKRLDDTIHATVFGVFVVAIIQGTLGGIMFWILGLPMPALWGTVMAVMAMVPYLGPSIVWGPTSIILAISGDWVRALVLFGVGATAIALIDNVLYPVLVGNRLRQHTVITFLAIVGGVLLFGGSGIILGPIVVSLTFFLLEVWRKRTAAGQPAECA